MEDNVSLSKFSGRTSTPSSGRSVSHASILSISSTSSECTPPGDDPQPRKKRRVREDSADQKFKLPVFSPSIRQCIKKDAFYTSTQRNCLIKEACTALRGYCWERDKPITNFDKRDLAISLCKLAQKSLGDSETTSKPEVSVAGILLFVCMYVCGVP